MYKYKYKITIEYNGANYCGWQKQSNVKTVQGTIETALSKFYNQKIVLFGSGRTDTGVHALGQIAHFTTEKEYDTTKVKNGINFYLKEENISILSSQKVDLNFNARFDAISRTYVYLIFNRYESSPIYSQFAWHIREKLDLRLMEESTDLLIGTQNLSSFRGSGCQAKTPIKTINYIHINKKESHLISIEINAPSFLYHQVRNIIGMLKEVGKGKLNRENIRQVIESKDRNLAPTTAPAHGLYLQEIEY